MKFFILLCLLITYSFSAYTFQSTCTSEIADNNGGYCVTISNGTTTFDIFIPNSYPDFVTNSAGGDTIEFGLPEINAETDFNCLVMKSLFSYTEASTLPAARIPFIIRCIFPDIDSTITATNIDTSDTAEYVVGLNGYFLPFNEWWATYLANWNSIS